MLFITSRHLKPRMILARDVKLNNDNNFNTLLLAKGQVLNNTFIYKMKHHHINGAYIEIEAFSDINVATFIDDKLVSRLLAQVKDVYFEFKISAGKVSVETLSHISSVVDDLVAELIDKSSLKFNIIDFKNYDNYSYQHSLNVAVMSVLTGISLSYSEHMLHDLGMAGLLHDIGKISIPLEILNKPGELTDEEFEVVKLHPVYAVDQLAGLVSGSILRGIESHHEKLDGTGYPYGRKGCSINNYGKILTVCDVYDALTSERSYRKALFPNDVIEYIMGSVDKQFDYEIVKSFLKVIVAYPIGTFVILSSGSLAVVVKNHAENIMRPVIRIINKNGTVGKDVDLLYDKDYMNVTITDMGYDYSGTCLNKILKPHNKLN